jgi:hypothetical protein
MDGDRPENDSIFRQLSDFRREKKASLSGGIFSRRAVLKLAAATGIFGALSLELRSPKPTTAQSILGDGWQVLSYSSPILPIHAALLRTGKLLFITGSSNDPTNYPFIHGSVIIDPTVPDGAPFFSNNLYDAQGTLSDPFCLGHSFLSDGRLLGAGGTLTYDPFTGRLDAATFDAQTQQWVLQPSMARGRWYPTLTTLGDGRVLAISGKDTNGQITSVVESYIDGLGWAQMFQTDKGWPMYAHNYLMANGQIFFAGAMFGNTNGVTPRILNIATNTYKLVNGLSNTGLRNQAHDDRWWPEQQRSQHPDNSQL